MNLVRVVIFELFNFFEKFDGNDAYSSTLVSISFVYIDLFFIGIVHLKLIHLLSRNMLWLVLLAILLLSKLILYFYFNREEYEVWKDSGRSSKKLLIIILASSVFLTLLMIFSVDSVSPLN